MRQTSRRNSLAVRAIAAVGSALHRPDREATGDGEGREYECDFMS
jgi:hypothetical protein